MAAHMEDSIDGLNDLNKSANLNPPVKENWLLIFIFILILSGIGFYLFNNLRRPSSPTVLSIDTNPLDGFLLGTINRGLGWTSYAGLYPCAKDIKQARDFINLAVSYVKIREEDRPNEDRTINTNYLFQDDVIEWSFKFIEEGPFYKVVKLFDSEPARIFDTIVDRSKNYNNQSSKSVYICKSSNWEYINTAYRIRGGFQDDLNYPYELDSMFLKLNKYRTLLESYINSDTVGVIKIPNTVIINEKYLDDSMNLLYRLNYDKFLRSCGIGGCKLDFHQRDIKKVGDNWEVTDKIQWTESNDSPPLGGYKILRNYSIEVDSKTRIIRAFGIFDE